MRRHLKMLKKNHRVCIVILNWNGWRDTIECLESLFRISYNNYQVVVIDNASTDGSLEIMEKWAVGQEIESIKIPGELFHLTHPPVKKPIDYIEYSREEAESGGIAGKESKLVDFIRNQEDNAANVLDPTSNYPLIFVHNENNLGFTGGNNVGLKYVINDFLGFDYALLLNNDVVVDKDFLDHLISCAEKFPNSGIVGPKIYYYDNPKILQGIGSYVDLSKWVSQIVGCNAPDQSQFDSYLKFSYIAGVCFLVKVSVLRIVGLLDEKFFMYAEDLDYCLRAQKRGFECIYTPYSKIWHKWVKSSNLRFATFMSFRNRIWLIKKHLSDKLFVTSLIRLFLIKIPLNILYYIKKGYFSRILPLCYGVFFGILGTNKTYFLKKN